MMFRTQINIFNIMASTNANWFIYYFKRIPLIGKILPDSIYGHIGVKKKIAVLAAILKALGNLLGKAVIVGLMMFLPALWIGKEFSPSLRYDSYLHIFFILNFVGSFLSSSAFQNGRNQFICIRLMRMDAKSYIVSTMLFHNLTNFLCFLPAYIVFTVLLGGTLLQGILLAVLAACFSFIGEAVHLLIYSKTGMILCKKAAFVLSLGALCLATAYVPIFLHSPLVLSPILFRLPFVLAFLVLSAVCVSYLIQSRSYHAIAAVILKAAEFSVNSSLEMNKTKFAGVAVREKEFKAEDLNSHKFDEKKGFAYLNAIFFERHKRLLVKPIFIRLVIIAVLFIGCVILSVCLPEFNKQLATQKDNILPIFVFIMYFASIGEHISKAMFYNCDMSLLRYSFYRDKNAILSNFRVRLIRIAGLNLLVASAISAAVVGLFAICQIDWPVVNMVSFVLSILFLSLFFSVHHLFLYYVFQPYTTELGMKNPFFSVIHSAVYLACYFCLRIKSTPSYFALIVLAATVLYIIVALLLVYKYAPKTFRVK